MALILSIETASAVCSVALHKAGRLLAHMEVFLRYGHAECLMVIIDNLFKISNSIKTNLSAVAVSRGPGSYTGLRIGTAVGKGLCYGLDIPLIAVGTLEAMAYGMCRMVDGNTLLCPTIDARRDAVYMLIMDSKGQIIRSAHVEIINSSTYARLPNQPLWFFGDGVTKCENLLSQYPNIRFITGVMPSAIHVGALALEKFQKGVWQDILAYDPDYLSQF